MQALIQLDSEETRFYWAITVLGTCSSLHGTFPIVTGAARLCHQERSKGGIQMAASPGCRDGFIYNLIKSSPGVMRAPRSVQVGLDHPLCTYALLLPSHLHFAAAANLLFLLLQVQFQIPGLCPLLSPHPVFWSLESWVENPSILLLLRCSGGAQVSG